MSDPDLAQSELLAAARRGLSPSSADSERVFAAVERALGAPFPALPEVQGGQPVVHPFLSKLAMKRLLTAFAVAGAGIGGYYAGFRAGLRSSTGEGSHALLAPPASAPAVPISVPASRASAEREPAASPPVGALRGAKHEARVGAPSAASATPSALSLEQEVRTLRRVERALREQNPRLALALLSDLEREVPQGQLREERSAAETMARCALGFGAPLLLAREFSERYPESAYVARVRQVCEVDVDARATQTEPGRVEK